MASQLYRPYGGVRYQSGILPTDLGFTHQRADATSGLDDYGARWYDPLAGQFTSADTTLAGGLNRYAYVAGNPETWVDPSGHAQILPDTPPRPVEYAPPAPLPGITIPPAFWVIATGFGLGLASMELWAWQTTHSSSSAASSNSPVAVRQQSKAARHQSNALDAANEPPPPPTPVHIVQSISPGGSEASDDHAAPQSEPQPDAGGSAARIGFGQPPNDVRDHSIGSDNASYIDVIWGAGTVANGDDITLYRAVDDAEFQVMGGQFRYGQSGLKYFTTSAESAVWFADVEMNGLSRPFHIMSGTVPADVLMQPNVRIGPHPVPGRGLIWEVSFDGTPGDTLAFIQNVTDVQELP